jgi:hypothetical protein
MHLNLEIPDDLAQRLGNAGSGDLTRRALEGFALEEYKANRLGRPDLRRLLGFTTRYELDGFLKAHGVWDDTTIEDVRHDLRDLGSLGL